MLACVFLPVSAECVGKIWPVFWVSIPAMNSGERFIAIWLPFQRQERDLLPIINGRIVQWEVFFFFFKKIKHSCTSVESSWNVMAQGDSLEGKWRGNWRMEWVASTLHTTSKYGVSSITTADAHTSTDSSRQNWRSCRFKWTRPFGRKTKSGFCACAITFQLASTSMWVALTNICASTLNIISVYYINKIQQDATDAGIYLLQNHSTCFGYLSHPSSGVHQTVTAASGTDHSIRATTFRQRGL